MANAIPESVTHLIEAFSRLPGIGPKTASRLTYFLLRAPDDLASVLAQAVSELKSRTRLCSICFNITEEDPCPICTDPQRDGSLVAVVEEPLDALALEKTNSFNGRYHVLHGVINPREGVGLEQLKIRELVKRVQQQNITELIISTNPGTLGDYTAALIKQEVDNAKLNVRLTRLARGLATGSDLEYVDSGTIVKALQGRQAL
jgi:recombination protein RecR